MLPHRRRGSLEKRSMRSIALILTTVLSLGISCSAFADSSIESRVDDREVYLVTSMIAGTVPKVGPLRHASIAICPKGVSPVVYENGIPVSNCRECQFYGTRVMERGFKTDKKRLHVKATKIRGIAASTVEQCMRSHRQMNVPLLHDCRAHVIQVLGLRDRRGRLRPAFTLR